MKAYINSLYLCVNDMNRAIRFYEDFFEQSVTKRDDIYSVFDIEGFRLGLFAYERMNENHTFGSNCLPSISVESIDVLKRKIANLEICFPITKIGCNWVAEFIDSEGNHIELTAPIAGKMQLKSEKLTEEQAKEISSWKYEGEYAMYNLPDWDTMVKKNFSLCDEARRDRYTAYLNEEGDLVGYTNLLDEGSHIFFGIGIKPNLCSRGIGKTITKLSLEECSHRWPGKPVVLEVRTWNKRAVNCYKSQGFEIKYTKTEKTYVGEGEFFVMQYA